jgi:hypothetical protein
MKNFSPVQKYFSEAQEGEYPHLCFFSTFTKELLKTLLGRDKHGIFNNIGTLEKLSPHLREKPLCF